MWDWIEYVLDIVVQIVFFPYFIVRQFRADMKFLSHFEKPRRETLRERVSRLYDGSYLEWFGHEHPVLLTIISFAALFRVLVWVVNYTGHP